MPNAEITVWTIGHSTHSYERFLDLLRAAGVTAIADVRTYPYSRRSPHFGREALKQALGKDGIAYSFLGDELGLRRLGSEFYCDGVIDYQRVATTPRFQHGLDRVVDGAGKYRVALMCAEQDPMTCHRCLLVGRALAGRGVTLRHILTDGGVASQDDIEARLLEIYGRAEGDLLLSGDERRALAYRDHARRIGYVLDAEPGRAVADDPGGAGMIELN